MMDMARKHHAKFYPFRAWAIWLVSALFMCYKYAIEVSPSVMTVDLMRSFSIGGTTLGNLAACYFYAYLFLQLPAGWLLDWFGPRKMTTMAIALCAIGTFFFSQAYTLFFAGMGRFLSGAGAAFAAVSCLKLIANWFPFRRFAFMAGLMMTMAMFGAIGGQAPLVAFIEEMSWRGAMKWVGLIGCILALLFFIVVRDKTSDSSNSPSIRTNNCSSLQGIVYLFKQPQSWWLSIYSGFAFAPVMVFGGLWGVSFIAEGFELTKAFSAQMISLIFIGFAVGAPTLGWYSDWLGKRKIVMFWGTIFATIFLIFIIYVPTISLHFLSVFLFLFGFFISSFLLCFTMIKEINPAFLSATAIGLMNAFDALFGAISDPLTGKLLDMQWGGKLLEGARIFSLQAYQTAFLLLPIYLSFALLILLKIKETHCKPSYPTPLP